jgi:hypothetical protein
MDDYLINNLINESSGRYFVIALVETGGDSRNPMSMVYLQEKLMSG